MAEGADYYGVLGVAVDSEDIVIRAAYRVLMNKYHPDKWTGASSLSETKAREINEAYAVLSDPVARSNYDANRGRWPNAAPQRPNNASQSSAADFTPRTKKQSGPGLLRFALGIVGLVAVVAMIAALASRDHSRQSEFAFVPQSAPVPVAVAAPVARIQSPIVAPSLPIHPASDRSILRTNSVARDLAGLLGIWKLARATDCEATYRVATDGGGRLTLTGPDGTEQREAIVGMDGAWLRTAVGEVSSFYRREGRFLVYRDGSKANARSETRFARCG